jgi:hypothetical protein
LTAGQTQQLVSTNVTCSGSAYSYTVSISYTDVSTNSNHVYTGDGQTLDGNCAS